MTMTPTPMSKRAAREGRWVSLPPDPAIFNALGGGHTLESAIADIIDNSIDAAAATVQVRFLTDNAELRGIQIRDDGTGMSSEALEKALTLGSRREYLDSDLGHFGIGLKAASMRHAEVLTVYTAHIGQHGPQYSGIELSPSANQEEIGAFILPSERAELGYRYGPDTDTETSGTVVQWTGIRGASGSSTVADRQEWLNSVIEKVRYTLGLVFHRLIENGEVRIQIDMFDIHQHLSGAPSTVDPVNPFAYHLPGRKSFPIDLAAILANGVGVTARCHILPPKGHDRLLGRREEWQGIYIYRNDRLLTLSAGWQGLANWKRELRLARVEIDLTDELLEFIKPTPEKNGVVVDADVLRAMGHAKSVDGVLSFGDFLETATTVWKESNKRSTDKPVTQIADGLPTKLIEVIGESFGWRADKAPIRIVWQAFHQDELFKVDLGRRELQINESYASVFGGEDSPSAHIFTMLLYLLTEANYTRESHLRASTFEHLQQIEVALIAAIDLAANRAPRALTHFRGTPATALAALLGTPQPDSDLTAAQPAILASSVNEVGLFSGFSFVEEADSELGLLSVEPHNESAITGELTEIGEFNLLIDSEEQPVPVLDEVTTLPSYRAASGRSVALPAMPSDPIDQTDLEIFLLYCRGLSLAETAHQVGRSDFDVATSLARSFFGSEATDDDATLAPYHGMAYTPDERERILRHYHGGKGLGVVEIARLVGRTPLAVAWRLLDSPKRPVPIDKRVRRSVRRRARID